ncbi:glycoside hydrolase family 23 protein [Rhodotorula graminis WP1]|uniref:Glycoside hydrolase family 23 protein n=1 Tax=Rhodotorula graminis (strain WP1) TaxID=578459 RepID=A0A194S8W9_RHOGW|nr:glycoside hydrolase family 23 protein [Rhodotorula graminis WP1]KPV75851.1 glycoside hydrolase family 23 protein [Rhodotorula graminis WP1]
MSWVVLGLKWYENLSYSGATAAQWSGCCLCQNNLDYLYQMTNGWLMGRTGYEMGSYHNLKVCGHQD